VRDETSRGQKDLPYGLRANDFNYSNPVSNADQGGWEGFMALNRILADVGLVMDVARDFEAIGIADLSIERASLVERAAAAVATFRSVQISTNDLVAHSAKQIAHLRRDKETFVPIFTTNHCDSECKMCGMRNSNGKLLRKFSSKSTIEDQLRILYDIEGVRAAGFLTGEYSDKYTRLANAFLIGWAISRAFELGFQKVYFNIGSLLPDEIEVLADWLEPHRTRPVTMCVFQETYSQKSYARFMGSAERGIPKADFVQRINSFDNWLDAGFHNVNPGFLVGLSSIEEDLIQLIYHVAHLRGRGAELTISLPRLRPALETANNHSVRDETYLRLIATVALFCPECRIVLTTREDQAFQDSALPLIGTISPGSPDVAPYKRQSPASNEEISSQFMIPDHRRPREILRRIVAMGYPITYFEDRGLAESLSVDSA
jgi:2-iminoacetate synthase